MNDGPLLSGQCIVHILIPNAMATICPELERLKNTHEQSKAAGSVIVNESSTGKSATDATSPEKFGKNETAATGPDVQARPPKTQAKDVQLGQTGPSGNRSSQTTPIQGSDRVEGRISDDLSIPVEKGSLEPPSTPASNNKGASGHSGEPNSKKETETDVDTKKEKDRAEKQGSCSDLEHHRAPSAAESVQTLREEEPTELETNLDVATEQDPEALEQTITNKALRQQSWEQPERLAVSRRLQVSTIEELLLQAPLPATANAHEVPEANALFTALQELKSTHQESSDTEEKRLSATIDHSEQATSVWDSARASMTLDSEWISSLHTGNLLIREGQDLLHTMEEEKPVLRKRRLIQQFSGTLEASMLFRQSAQTNTFYVTRRDELPAVDSGDGVNSKARVLESRLRIPKDQSVERALYALLPTPLGSNDKEAEFLGQVWVRMELVFFYQLHYCLIPGYDHDHGD